MKKSVKPLNSEIKSVNIEDLFDIQELQTLQDDFADATGVASIITYPDGTPITKPSNFTHLCMDIIRKSSKGCKNCYRSDAILGKLNMNGPTIKRCESIGLWDAGASITVNGEHIANWLMGQVRDENHNEKEVIEYAREIKVDPDETLKAFREIPLISRVKFEKIAKMLFTLAQHISGVAYKNLQMKLHIKEQEKIKNALFLSQQRYKSLTENTPDWLWEMDTNAKFLYVSPRVEELLGYTPDELLGKSGFDLMPPREAVSIEKDFNRYVEKGETFYRLRNINIHKNGNWVYMESSGTPFFDSQGLLLGYRGIDRDITERVKAEIEADKFKTIADTAGYGVAIFNLKGKLSYSNESFAAMHGFNKKEIINKDISLFYNDESFKKIKKVVEGLHQNQEPKNMEMENRRKDHSLFPVIMSAKLLKHGSMTPDSFTMILMDITERKEQEQRLFQSQKMDSIGQLAGGIAHDFNNMLTGIMGSTEILIDLLQGNEKYQNYLSLIMESANRAADLSRNLLAFGKKGSKIFSMVNLHQILRETISILSKTLDRNILITQNFLAERFTVYGDYSQLQSVIMNLGINASHAMPSGGTLIFQTSEILLSEQHDTSSSTSLSPGNYIKLQITDSGTGIDPEHIHQIFEPFFTTKEQGMGMGLSAVYGIIEQHKGSISVESELNEGTRFQILLPT